MGETVRLRSVPAALVASRHPRRLMPIWRWQGGRRRQQPAGARAKITYLTRHPGIVRNRTAGFTSGTDARAVQLQRSSLPKNGVSNLNGLRAFAPYDTG